MTKGGNRPKTKGTSAREKGRQGVGGPRSMCRESNKGTTKRPRRRSQPS